MTMICRLCQILGTVLLFLTIIANAEDEIEVEGYTSFGRGSCQDERGRMYSYLQRVMTFPNAETCGKQECERFAGLGPYQGFEYSVAKRCTCLFDNDKVPVVPNNSDEPQYVTKKDSGGGPVAGTSGTPGTHCFQFGNSGFMTGNMGVFYTATLLASATMHMML